MTSPIIEWANPDRTWAKALFNSLKMSAIISGSIDHQRGTIYVDSLDDPKVAWWSFSVLNAVAGDSKLDAARYIIEQFPYIRVLNVANEDWENLVRSLWREELYTMPRTRLSEETLDIKHLRKLKEPLPEGFMLQKVDRESLDNLADAAMAYHILQFFGTPDDFIENGFGFCIKHGEKVVSMASTYTPYSNAIEIEIDTFDSPEYRRKGLATAAGAALLEYALDNGLTPNWDAQTQISVKLAQKLGYTNPEPYEVFIRVKPEHKEKLLAALA